MGATNRGVEPKVVASRVSTVRSVASSVDEAPGSGLGPFLIKILDPRPCYN